MPSLRLASGLPFTSAHLALRGVVCALPRTEIHNAELAERFGAEGVADVSKMIGVQSRRRAADGQRLWTGHGVSVWRAMSRSVSSTVARYHQKIQSRYASS